MVKRIKQIEEEINKIKSKLNKIGEMRPGSLTQQHRKAKGKYGSYWHLSYTHNKKGRTEYIRDEFVDEVTKQIKNYKLFKALSEEWIALAIEHAQIKMKELREVE